MHTINHKNTEMSSLHLTKPGNNPSASVDFTTLLLIIDLALASMATTPSGSRAKRTLGRLLVANDDLKDTELATQIAEIIDAYPSHPDFKLSSTLDLHR